NAVFGTSTDKIALLSRDPDMIIKHEHLHYHPSQHHFQAFTLDRIDEILAQLPDASASQSSDSTSLAPSLFPPEPQGTAQEAQDNAAVAMPARQQEPAQDGSGMHPHSQPASDKKD